MTSTDSTLFDIMESFSFREDDLSSSAHMETRATLSLHKLDHRGAHVLRGGAASVSPTTRHVPTSWRQTAPSEVEKETEHSRTFYEAEIAKYQTIGQEQSEKKKVQQADAEGADLKYNQLNTHDDQFDLSDAMLSIAISLLALTALTGKKWLYWVSMIPTVLGVFMGLAGLFGWGIHPDVLTRLLS